MRTGLWRSRKTRDAVLSSSEPINADGSFETLGSSRVPLKSSRGPETSSRTSDSAVNFSTTYMLISFPPGQWHAKSATSGPTNAIHFLESALDFFGLRDDP